MKKRLLSALLALALVFVLLPTTALAGETTGSDYDISINGTGWKFETDDSGACIPVYYYANYTFNTDAGYGFRTNDNLMLTKEGNTVTITIRRGTSHDHGNYSPITFTLKKESTKKNDVPCIEMGNDNNLVITGKGTLNITRNESKSYGAALYSNVGDITINGGITVNVSFQNGNDYSNKNASSNAIHVGNNHNLTVSGSGTNVTATNQGFDSLPATVCVEGGTITVSGGASLSATNTYADNFSGSSVTQHFKSYAISGTESKPCTLIVADEKSSVTAWAYDEKYGKPFGFVTYNITGATVKAGSDAYYATETTIDNINGKEYVKISVPALQRTSDVLIAGKNAVVGQWTNIPAAATGTGSYYYDADKKELTLKDVNITHSDGAIVQFMAGAPYIIKLEGTNSIKDVNSFIRVPERGYESLDGLSVTISGAGSLEVIARGNAITMLKGNLIFNNTGAIALETTTINGKAINVSGDISIGDDFNKNLRITADNGDMTFDPTNQYTDYNDLKNYKSITIASKPSETYYNSTAMKYGETRNAGSGTISCDENGVITLNGATEGTLEFRSSADSTLVLEGTNTLSSIVTTQKGLTISGSGSLTVGSIKVHNQKNSSDDKPNLTINGATVTVGTAELTTRAIDIDGDLTVTNGSLKATSTSDSVPTVQVGGNASFTGSTVTITNHSTTQGERYKDSNAASSALHVNGAVTISGGTVMAEAKAGGNAIRAVGNITVSNGATVTAKNNSQYFNAITAGSATGGEVKTLHNLIVSGENTRITATNTHDNNLTYGGAINAYIKNANEGHYLKVGTDTKAIAPNVNTTVRNNSLTITRGDAYETPQVAANYTIAGQTMYVGKYYKTDARGNITEGTAQDYNIFCDSENDFTLNNATISSTGTSGSTGVIKTNLNYSSAQFHIKLIGTNSINNAGHHAILGEGAYSTIIIENAENASNASLTISGNFLPVYSFGNVTINAEVVIINTNGNLISTNKGGHANGAFDLGSGYKCYASTDVSGSPLETYDAAKSSTYKYLRITKENLAPTTPTPQTPFTIDGIPAQFVDGGMIATTGVTATSSNNINLPIDRVKWYTFTPVFGSDGRMNSVSDKTEATGNFEAGKYYVVEIKFVQDLSPFESWDMKVSGWSDNDVYRQSVTARNDIEIYFLTPASAATHEHNWAENYDPVYHWKMCTYDGCTAIKDKALHVWNAWHTSNNEQQHSKSCSECSYSTPPHDIDLAYVSDGEQGHHLYCKHDGCTFVTGTTAHNYEEGSNICTDCGYNKFAPCDHTGDHTYTNNGDGTHKVTCKACGATIVEKQNHEFNPTGVCIYCGATQSGGDPTPDNPGTIVIIRPAEEEKPAQQPNPSTGANDLVGLAVAAAVAAALGSAALLRKHD